MTEAASPVPLSGAVLGYNRSIQAMRTLYAMKKILDLLFPPRRKRLPWLGVYLENLNSPLFQRPGVRYFRGI
jgi:hypothetical protein